MEYAALDENDASFIEGGDCLVNIQSPQSNGDVKAFIKTLQKDVAAAKKSGGLEPPNKTSNSVLRSYAFAGSLCNPYL